MKSSIKFKYFCYCLFILFLQNCGQKKGNSAGTENKDSTFYSMVEFRSVVKYDTHVHFNVQDTIFMNEAVKANFRLLTVNVNPSYYPSIEEQQRIALQLIKDYPKHLAYATTFDGSNLGKQDWQQQTLSYLENSFKNDAIAVKVWKNIGMELRDMDGSFVMIDDARFDPILDFVEERDVTLIGHLGEPKNAWLPIEKMTITGDKRYFTKNPQYHMYLHKEFPSYEEQINARDRMLKKHPNLKFVGAHLGSLEWSVDELANHLDKFPNVAVDMAARVSHLQFQSMGHWQKVHDFVIKYQDRLIYSTDLNVEFTANPEELKKRMNERWLSDWKFFVTKEDMTISDFEGTFKGLKLPREIVDKIYRKNAEKWFPGMQL